MEDKKIIRKCQIGDKEAFCELISIYHSFVYKFLVKISEDERIAEDLTQDTFIKIIKNIDKFDLEGKAKFSTYVITVSKNCYIDYIRREKKWMQVIPIEESSNIEDININVENLALDKMYNQDIMEQIENLTDEQKLVIKMKYIEGLTLKEIGNKLNIETKTVKSRIHNGIVRLRKTLGKGDGYEGK